jgi:hypothetical protein
LRSLLPSDAFEAKLTFVSLQEACVNMNMRSADNTYRNLSFPLYRCLVSRCIAVALAHCIGACVIGPTYRGRADPCFPVNSGKNTQDNNREVDGIFRGFLPSLSLSLP